MDKKMLPITICKKTEECLNENLWEIWDSLPNGFNELYLANDGWTPDEKEISFEKYVKKVYEYLRLYVLRDMRTKEEKPFIDKRKIIK
jgi:hypothetical protein